MKRKSSFLFLFTFFVLVFTLLLPASLSAKSKPLLKSTKVRWNLKPNKTITFKTYYSGYDYFDIKATLKNFKINDSEKTGYKTLNFSIHYQFPNLKLTKAQVKKIIKADGSFKFLWTVLDDRTGKTLEAENDLDVKVEYEPWIFSDEYYEFFDNNGESVSYHKTAKKNVTVTYPKDFDRLCIMVGGSSDPFNEEKSFWDGTLPFKKTSYYKKDMKELSSFMKIKNSK